MSSKHEPLVVEKSHEYAAQVKANLLQLLQEKSKTDPEIASVLTQLTGLGITTAIGAQTAVTTQVPSFRLIDADNDGWHGYINLSGLENGNYRLTPSAESRWSLNNGNTLSDFHGHDVEMDGPDIGIPKLKLRVGALVMLVRSTDLFGGVIDTIVDFPPGTDHWDFRIAGGLEPTDPFALYFVIADHAGTYSDNSGVCRVDLSAR
jgi:hypothetical protein